MHPDGVYLPMFLSVHASVILPPATSDLLPDIPFKRRSVGTACGFAQFSISISSVAQLVTVSRLSFLDCSSTSRCASQPPSVTENNEQPWLRMAATSPQL